jgi:hypothetical protein
MCPQILSMPIRRRPGFYSVLSFRYSDNDDSDLAAADGREESETVTLVVGYLVFRITSGDTCSQQVREPMVLGCSSRLVKQDGVKRRGPSLRER